MKVTDTKSGPPNQEQLSEHKKTQNRKNSPFKVLSVLTTVFFVGVCTQVNAQFAKGADVGYLLSMEKLGYTWKNSSGKQEDLLVIMKEKNINSIRLRTWVNPDPTNERLHCSQSETIAMAVRCKKLGFRIMIDFHYGDTWNSVGVQNPPAAWASMSYTQMQTALHDYVYNFCVALKAAGVTPEWIQNGNEINSGICRPTGAIGHPAQMAGLLNQGYNAMKAVFPKVKVIIHVAQPQNTAAMTLLDTYKANGGKWDVTGISSYSSSVLASAIESIKAKHTQEIMMVEIGAEAGNPGKAKTLVQNWITELVKINKACEGGVFYWEPEVYTPFSTRTNNAWDPNTKMPLATMDGYAIAITNCSIVMDIEEPAQLAEPEITSCYPNPFTKELTISQKDDFEYELYDMTGTALEIGKAQGAAHVGAKLPSGMYVVRVHSSGGNKVYKVTKNE